MSPRASIIFGLLIGLALVWESFSSADLNNQVGQTEIQATEADGALIAGGFQVVRSLFPSYMLLSLKLKNGSLVRCGGALISSREIITAAHCFEDVSSVRAFAATLVSDNNEFVDGSRFPPSEKKVATWAISPDFKPDTLMDDFAIIRLKQDIVESDELKPARIANGPPSAGQLLWQVGMGAYDHSLLPNNETFEHLSPVILAIPVVQQACNVTLSTWICATPKEGLGDTCGGKCSNAFPDQLSPGNL